MLVNNFADAFRQLKRASKTSLQSTSQPVDTSHRKTVSFAESKPGTLPATYSLNRQLMASAKSHDRVDVIALFDNQKSIEAQIWHDIYDISARVKPNIPKAPRISKFSTFPIVDKKTPLHTNSMPLTDTGSNSFFQTEEEKKYDKSKREYLRCMQTVRVWDGKELKSSAEPWQELHDEQRNYYIDVLRPLLMKAGDEDSRNLIKRWGVSQQKDSAVEGSAWQVEQEMDVLRDINEKLFGKPDFEYRHQ